MLPGVALVSHYQVPCDTGFLIYDCISGVFRHHFLHRLHVEKTLYGMENGRNGTFGHSPIGQAN